MILGLEWRRIFCTAAGFFTSPSRCAVADSCSISLDRRLTEGETWQTLVDAADPDVEGIGSRGMAFERLDQLALEHLYGLR